MGDNPIMKMRIEFGFIISNQVWLYHVLHLCIFRPLLWDRVVPLIIFPAVQEKRRELDSDNM